MKELHSHIGWKIQEVHFFGKTIEVAGNIARGNRHHSRLNIAVRPWLNNIHRFNIHTHTHAHTHSMSNAPTHFDCKRLVLWVMQSETLSILNIFHTIPIICLISTPRHKRKLFKKREYHSTNTWCWVIVWTNLSVLRNKKTNCNKTNN